MAGVQRTGPVPIEIANQDTRERRAPQPRLVAADEEEPTLASYLETVNQARWLILVATLLAVTGAGLYVFFATPIYQSDTLVQLEEKKGTLSGLDDLSNMFSSPSPAETEIEILRSRTLVGSVVDELHLYVLAEPRYFPMVGKGIARRRASDGPASPVLDLASFAWGGERIAVDRIEVPRRWEGKRLTLVARGAGRYELLDPNGSLIASGEAGKALAAGELGLFVSDLVAREGTQFWVARLPRTQVIEELQGDLVIAEKGKKTGILRVGLEAPAPERLAAVLDAIARTYLRQNVERKSAEAEKTLRFINGQLPQLRQSVDVAEQALSTYRAMNGSVDVSLETKGALDRAVDVEKELTGLELQVSEAKQRFTDSHPAMITARAKIARLSVERDEINARIKRLPAAELQSARLIRDMKVANELYVLLLNKAQELQVVKSGTIGNVRKRLGRLGGARSRAAQCSRHRGPAELAHEPPVRARRGAQQHRRHQRAEPRHRQVFRVREPRARTSRQRHARVAGGRRSAQGPPAPLPRLREDARALRPHPRHGYREGRDPEDLREPALPCHG